MWAPRLRISHMMAGGAWAAAWLGTPQVINRADRGSGFWPELWLIGYAVPPMAGLLVVATWVVVLDLKRTGQARPFVVGFLRGGVVACLGVAGVCWTNYTWVARSYLDFLSKPVNATFDVLTLKPLLESSPPFSLAVTTIFHLIAFGLPQLVVAVACGLIVRASGLTIARVRRPGAELPGGSAAGDRVL